MSNSELKMSTFFYFLRAKLVWTSSHTSGSHYWWNRDFNFTSQPPQWTHVSHLLGHAQKYNDNKRGELISNWNIMKLKECLLKDGDTNSVYDQGEMKIKNPAWPLGKLLSHLISPKLWGTSLKINNIINYSNMCGRSHMLLK